MEVTLGHGRPRLVTYPAGVFEPARSARLAAWGTAVLQGDLPAAAAVRAVTGDDEPHEVELAGEPPAAFPAGPPTSADPAEPVHLAGPAHPAGPAHLAGLLTGLARAGVTGLRVVLPRPGDLLGLPGPAAFNLVALDAGECVLTEPLPDGRSWGLIPRITPFGSEWEPGTLVTWQVFDVAARRVTDVGSLAEAERALREALRAATELLADLDVSRWRDDAAQRIAALRDGGLPSGALPPTASPRSAAVLATALRVAVIIELATEDDGGAVTLHEAQARRQALQGLDGVTRRAMTAAVNALLEPRPHPRS